MVKSDNEGIKFDIQQSTGLSLEDARTAIERAQETITKNEVKELVTIAARPTLVTIQEAAEQFGLNPGTLRNWVAQGRLKLRGRITHPAPGGGKILVASEDVEYFTHHPPKRGRPSTRRQDI